MPIPRLPKYHYQGVMYPVSLDWVMFTPYAEFIVNNTLCRAYDEPKCTWWNMVLIDSINKSIHETGSFVYGMHFAISNTSDSEMRYNMTEKSCSGICFYQPNCTGAVYDRRINMCLTTDRVSIGPTTTYNMSERIPQASWFIKRNHSNHSMLLRERDRLIDYFDCRMDTFRCPNPA